MYDVTWHDSLQLCNMSALCSALFCTFGDRVLPQNLLVWPPSAIIFRLPMGSRPPIQGQPRFFQFHPRAEAAEAIITAFFQGDTLVENILSPYFFRPF